MASSGSNKRIGMTMPCRIPLNKCAYGNRNQISAVTKTYRQLAYQSINQRLSAKMAAASK